MKTPVITTLALLFFFSCTEERKKSGQSKQQVTHSQAETFATFYEKFCSDSVFQKSRIKFPLTTETHDFEVEKPIISAIKVSEWNFFNIKGLDKNHIFNIRKENDQYIVNATVADTGIYVDYIFQLWGSKWMLVKIVDQST